MPAPAIIGVLVWLARAALTVTAFGIRALITKGLPKMWRMLVHAGKKDGYQWAYKASGFVRHGWRPVGRLLVTGGRRGGAAVVQGVGRAIGTMAVGAWALGSDALNYIKNVNIGAALAMAHDVLTAAAKEKYGEVVKDLQEGAGNYTDEDLRKIMAKLNELAQDKEKLPERINTLTTDPYFQEFLNTSAGKPDVVGLRESNPHYQQIWTEVFEGNLELGMQARGIEYPRPDFDSSTMSRPEIDEWLRLEKEAIADANEAADLYLHLFHVSLFRPAYWKEFEAYRERRIAEEKRNQHQQKVQRREEKAEGKGVDPYRQKLEQGRRHWATNKEERR